MRMKQLKEQYRIINFNEFGDERGNLVVAEGSGIDVPFDIKRVFYMYGSDPDIIRGQHANRKTEFVLINVSGTSKVKVDHGYDVSDDSVLLVLASEHYDGAEYIRDYDMFLEEVRGNKENE